MEQARLRNRRRAGTSWGSGGGEVAGGGGAVLGSTSRWISRWDGGVLLLPPVAVSWSRARYWARDSSSAAVTASTGWGLGSRGRSSSSARGGSLTVGES